MFREAVLLILVGLILSACTSTATDTPVAEQPTDASPPTTEGPVATSGVNDFFAQNGLTLAPPSCDGVLTPEQTEGPYYKPDSPERNSLLESDPPGRRLILIGYVLDQDCQPIPDAWLDFWQADGRGVYDNSGYTLRGHQFTDKQGRYYLATVVPGQYPGRTEHIHVKVRAPRAASALTTQLYFPTAAANAQDRLFNPANLLRVEERDDYLVGFFDFIIAAE